MRAFGDAALGYPTVLFSFALLVVTGYWGTAPLGGLDVDALHRGHGGRGRRRRHQHGRVRRLHGGPRASNLQYRWMGLLACRNAVEAQDAALEGCARFLVRHPAAADLFSCRMSEGDRGSQ